MTTLMCKAVRFRLPSLDDPARLADPLAAHTNACLSCQAEAARFRRLQRSLAGLSDRVEVAPEGLAAAVESRLSGSESAASRVPEIMTRVAATAGAVAAAAGTVAMVRWMRARSAA